MEKVLILLLVVLAVAHAAPERGIIINLVRGSLGEEPSVSPGKDWASLELDLWCLRDGAGVPLPSLPQALFCASSTGIPGAHASHLQFTQSRGQGTARKL